MPGRAQRALGRWRFGREVARREVDPVDERRSFPAVLVGAPLDDVAREVARAPRVESASLAAKHARPNASQRLLVRALQYLGETPPMPPYGDSAGAVPVPKLARHVTKLGRNIKPAEMTDVLQRLKALDANRSNIPLPKGPLPTNLKGARQNMRGR